MALNVSGTSDSEELASAAVTVVLGEDESAMRAGVRRALEAGGLRVLAEASSAEDVVAAAAELQPTVCLLAVHLPGCGIAAAQRIKAARRDTKVVMLTGSDRDEDLFAAVRAGADGYLLKTPPPLGSPRRSPAWFREKPRSPDG